MEIIQVGKLYQPGRTAWAETIEFNYFQGKCRYTFFLRSPHPKEISAFKKGHIEISIAVINRVIFVPIVFSVPTEAIPGIIGDAAYSWWNLPLKERTEPTDKEQYPCQAILVDADNGIVKAICLFSLPPELSQILRAAIVEQIEGGEISRVEFEQTVTSVQNTYSPMELASRQTIYKLSRD